MVTTTCPDNSLPDTHAGNMAGAVEMSSMPVPIQPLPTAPSIPEGQYAGLAQIVAALLSPTITAAFDRAIAAGITQFRKELGDHAKRLSELEHRLCDLEDEMHLNSYQDKHSNLS